MQDLEFPGCMKSKQAIGMVSQLAAFFTVHVFKLTSNNYKYYRVSKWLLTLNKGKQVSVPM
jgi:hypothetical protein